MLKLFSASFNHRGVTVVLAKNAHEASRMINEARALTHDHAEPGDLTEHQMVPGVVVDDWGDA